MRADGSWAAAGTVALGTVGAAQRSSAVNGSGAAGRAVTVRPSQIVAPAASDAVSVQVWVAGSSVRGSGEFRSPTWSRGVPLVSTVNVKVAEFGTVSQELNVALAVPAGTAAVVPSTAAVGMVVVAIAAPLASAVA